ncbi:MAG TPA: DUF4424 family protein [Methylocystis sp.]|nr:DUF4424 family protein [Methylocystis sp.]
MKASAAALTLIAGALAFSSVAKAEPRKPQSAPAPPQATAAALNDQQSSEPEPSALAVGALETGVDPALSLVSMDISVSAGKIDYAYAFKNSASNTIEVNATVVMPSLTASDDGSEYWTLPAMDPENPVGLAVTVGEAPVAGKAHVHALALGLNRLSELEQAHLPLIPFGPDTDKALTALTPEAAARLMAQALISPRDPAHPEKPPIADWSLEVTRSFKLALPAGKTTMVRTSFAPIKAVYKMGKADADDLDDLKDDQCLSPRALSTLKARLKAGGSFEVMELAVDGDTPTNWIDGPKVNVTVQKPKPESVAAFCGMNEKAVTSNVATGSPPEEAETSELQIMIFTPSDK